MRALLIVAMCMVLAGCPLFGPGRVQTETVYQEVKVPVSNVPMPPDTSCPQPRIETLTDLQAAQDGEVAKAYRIAIEQLRDCSRIREAVIDKYREIAEDDQRKLADLERQAMSAGPVASAGPTADTANQKVTTNPPIVSIDADERLLQMERKKEFDKLGVEFESLNTKDYDEEIPE